MLDNLSNNEITCCQGLKYIFKGLFHAVWYKIYRFLSYRNEYQK